MSLHIIIVILYISLFSLLIAFIYLLLTLSWYFCLSNVFYKLFRNNNKVDDLIKEAIHFYTKELGINKESITINLKTKFSEGPTYIYGWIEKYNKVEMLGTYDLIIHLNYNIFTILSTVAHEIIHVEQWEKGDLVEIDNKTIWKGEDHTFTDYDNRPWEVDAFKREKDLANKFFEHKKMKKSMIRILLEVISPI